MEVYASNRQDFYHRFYSSLIRKYWSSEPEKLGRTVHRRNWFDFGAGKTGVKFGWSFHRGDRFSAEIYIGTKDRETNLVYLQRLKEYVRSNTRLREELSGEELPSKKACRIAFYHKAVVDELMKQPSQVEEILDWACEKMKKLEEMFGELIRTL